MSLRVRLPPTLYRAAGPGTSPSRLAQLPGRPRAVLVVRTDGVGDLALGLPFLRRLRIAWPETRIVLVAAEGPGRLVAGSDLVDDVLVWQPIRRGRHTLAGQAQCLWFAREHLRGQRFDLAVVTSADVDVTNARWLAAASGAPVVVGFHPASRPHAPRERAEAALLTHRPTAADRTAHALTHDAELLRALGIGDVDGLTPSPMGVSVLDDRDLARCDDILGELPVASGPVVAVAVGGSRAGLRWPAHRYAQVVNAAHRSHDVRVVLIGGPGEQGVALEFARHLAPQIPLVDAVGRAALRTTLALLARSDAYLGGATAAMHLASGVGTPCVVVGGDPRSGPWSPGSTVAPPVHDAVTTALVSTLSSASIPVGGR